MKGWKTWAAAGLVGASAILSYLNMPELASALMAAGAAFGLVGIGHKIEKST